MQNPLEISCLPELQPPPVSDLISEPMPGQVLYIWRHENPNEAGVWRQVPMSLARPIKRVMCRKVAREAELMKAVSRSTDKPSQAKAIAALETFRVSQPRTVVWNKTLGREVPYCVFAMIRRRMTGVHA